MQTLCGMDMTAIGDETIEKPEDNPIMKACLGEIDIHNSMNRTGIGGYFYKGILGIMLTNFRPIDTIL